MKECLETDHPTDLVTSSVARWGKKASCNFTLYVSPTHRPQGRYAGTGTGSWANPEERSNHALESKASPPHTSRRSPTFSTEHSTFQERFLPSLTPSNVQVEEKQGGRPFFIFFFF